MRTRSPVRSDVKLRCSCGSEKFEMPARPAASDIIKCARCGAAGVLIADDGAHDNE
jgi:hypothetical protein